MKKLMLGIDAGGSKTNIALIDDKLNIIEEITTTAANINTDVNLALHSIQSGITLLLEKYNLKPIDINIGIGIAGYSNQKNREYLISHLAQLYQNIKITSDSHIAHLASYMGHDGAIIICGTGISAYYKIKSHIGQLGGWGFPHGDIGGAAWLGLEAIKLLCQAIDTQIPFTAMLEQIYKSYNLDTIHFKQWLQNASIASYANIAPIICESVNYDSNAKEIINKATHALINFIDTVTKTTHSLPIKLHGGLAKFYLPKLSSHFTTIKLNDTKAVIGAALLFNS